MGGILGCDGPIRVRVVGSRLIHREMGESDTYDLKKCYLVLLGSTVAIISIIIDLL